MQDIIWVDATRRSPYLSAVREDFSDGDPDALVGHVASGDVFDGYFLPEMNFTREDVVAWILTNAEQYDGFTFDELEAQGRMKVFGTATEAKNWIGMMLLSSPDTQSMH